MGFLDFLKKKELQEIDRLRKLNLELTEQLNESNSQMTGFEKGKAFEDYVENTMFPNYFYSIVRRTPSYEELQKRRVEDALAPDFTFRRKSNNFVFNVEAKFRSIINLSHDCNFSFCSWKQLQRYKSYDNNPTFIALGLGIDPYNPEMIVLFPAHGVSSNNVFLPELLKSYWFYKDRRVYSSHLMSMIDSQ